MFFVSTTAWDETFDGDSSDRSPGNLILLPSVPFCSRASIYVADDESRVEWQYEEFNALSLMTLLDAGVINPLEFPGINLEDESRE
jgi:hypothetical protein